MAADLTADNPAPITRTVTICPADGHDINITADTDIPGIFIVGDPNDTSKPGNLTLCGSDGATLTLTGVDTDNGAVISVYENSTLTIQDGVNITGNYIDNDGGEIACEGGTLIMNGGSIQNNLNKVNDVAIILTATENTAGLAFLGGNANVTGRIRFTTVNNQYPELSMGESIGTDTNLSIALRDSYWANRIVVHNGAKYSDRFTLAVPTEYALCASGGDLILGLPDQDNNQNGESTNRGTQTQNSVSPRPAERTIILTATPAPVTPQPADPVQIPAIHIPVLPTTEPAQSPVPFAGILAGCGIAAALRRWR